MLRRTYRTAQLCTIYDTLCTDAIMGLRDDVKHPMTACINIYTRCPALDRHVRGCCCTLDCTDQEDCSPPAMKL